VLARLAPLVGGVGGGTVGMGVGGPDGMPDVAKGGLSGQRRRRRRIRLGIVTDQDRPVPTVGNGKGRDDAAATTTTTTGTVVCRYYGTIH